MTGKEGKMVCPLKNPLCSDKVNCDALRLLEWMSKHTLDTDKVARLATIINQMCERRGK